MKRKVGEDLFKKKKKGFLIQHQYLQLYSVFGPSYLSELPGAWTTLWPEIRRCRSESGTCSGATAEGKASAPGRYPPPPPRPWSPCQSDRDERSSKFTVKRKKARSLTWTWWTSARLPLPSSSSKFLPPQTVRVPVYVHAHHLPLLQVHLLLWLRTIVKGSASCLPIIPLTAQALFIFKILSWSLNTTVF